MNKKHIAVLLIVTLLVVGTPFAAQADNTASLRLSEHVAQVGNRVEVTVQLSENSSVAMTQFAIRNDTEKLELISAAAGTVLNTPDIGVFAEIGRVTFVWDAVNAVTQGGTILTITYEIKDGAADTAAIWFDTEYDFVFMNTDYQTLPCETSDGSIAVRSVLYGDVNQDGAVNLADALLICNYAAGRLTLTADQILAGDVNGDSKVMLDDSLLICNYVAGRFSRFPVEE